MPLRLVVGQQRRVGRAGGSGCPQFQCSGAPSHPSATYRGVAAAAYRPLCCVKGGEKVGHQVFGVDEVIGVGPLLVTVPFPSAGAVGVGEGNDVVDVKFSGTGDHFSCARVSPPA